MEFAQMYAHFGAKVTVLQRSPRILPKDEPEISEELTKCLGEEGISIYTGVKVIEIRKKNNLKFVRCMVGDIEREFEAE